MVTVPLAAVRVTGNVAGAAAVDATATGAELVAAGVPGVVLPPVEDEEQAARAVMPTTAKTAYVSFAGGFMMSYFLPK
jgi:hypothetical protein